MGNKVSLSQGSSKSSSTSITSSPSLQGKPIEYNSDRNQSLTHVPKHLKKTKHLNKQQRHQLEKLQSEKSKENIGIALPYQPSQVDYTQQFKQFYQKSNKPEQYHRQQQQQQHHHHQQQQQLQPNKPLSPHAPPSFHQFERHDHSMHQSNSDVSEFALPDPTRFSMINSQQDIMTINDTDGPKIAYQWFEGRPFQNQTGIFLPNDQRELDRLRVLNYILRWCFQGDIVAPVKNALLGGSHVLSVGCGPGIWLGHPIIDFALDFKNSHFTAIDIANLLPDEPAYSDNINNGSSIKTATSYQPSYSFSPLHPLLGSNIPCSSYHQKYQQEAQKQQQRANNNNNNNNNSLDDLYNSTQSSIDITSSITSSASTTSSTDHTRSYNTCFSNTSSSTTTNEYFTNQTIFDNLDFYVMDVRKYKLPFPDNSFQFVMQRLSTSAYSVDQWDFVIEELIRVTEPGGYLQFIEIDYNSQGLGPQGQAWQEKLCSIMKKTKGLDPYIAGNIDHLLKKHGLSNVSKKQISVPFGSWGLDLGILWQQNLEAFIAASTPAFAMALGITPNECKNMWHGYKSELDNVKAFTNVYAVYGQKPY